jgi:hypothetical protein
LRKRVALFVIGGLFALEARLVFLLFNGKATSLDLEALRPSFISGSFQLRFDFLASIAEIFLLLSVLLLFYCPLSKASQSEMSLYSKTLFIVSLTSAFILARNFGFVLLCQLAVTQTLLVFNLRGNGPHRGSSALTTSVFFTVVDLCAFFAWSFEGDLSQWIASETISILILLPAITRLSVPFFSPWARGLFANCSVELAILFLSTSFISGTTLLMRSSIESPLLSTAATFAGFFGALLSLSDKPLSQFLIRVASVAGALTLFVLTVPHGPHLNIALYSLPLILMVGLALLIQRAMAEDESETMRGVLFPLWLLALTLLVILPSQIFPVQSPMWIATYSIVAFSSCLRVRVPIIQSAQGIRSMSSHFSAFDIANTWIFASLLVAAVLALQFFILRVELPL